MKRNLYIIFSSHVKLPNIIITPNKTFNRKGEEQKAMNNGGI